MQTEKTAFSVGCTLLPIVNWVMARETILIFMNVGANGWAARRFENIGLEAQPGSESGKAANKYCKSAPPSIFFKRLPLDGNDRIPKINSSMAFGQTAHVDPASDAIVILHELCRQIRNFHA